MKRRKRKAGANRKPAIKLPSKKTMVAQGINDFICLFYGPPGVGKTSFVDSLAPRVFFMSTDRGTRYFKALSQEVNDWDTLMATVGALQGNPEGYDMVCIDHVDDVVQMAEDHACQGLGVESLGEADWGKGWRAFKKELHDLIAKLKGVDAGIVFICHETVKEIETRAIKLSRTQPDIGKIAWKNIIPLCDLVGYLGYRRVKRAGKWKEVRTLETVPTEAVYVKDRTTRTRPSKGYEVLGKPPLGGRKFVATFGGATSGEEEQEEGRPKGRRAR